MNNTNSRYKIGIRGSGALAEVDNAGLIHFGNSKLLRWVIAGDDRWYDPSADASVRQTTRDGFPIVVTKMRVPTGDVTTLAYCVADHGGVVVFEVRNESTLPFAVVLSDPAWRTVRNPVPMLLWAFLIGSILLIAMLPAFLGLIIALPILGHASWHLYRKLLP